MHLKKLECIEEKYIKGLKEMNISMLSKLLQISTFIIFITSISIASKMAYEDELHWQKVYCKEVKAGTWPNYKKLKCE